MIILLNDYSMSRDHTKPTSTKSWLTDWFYVRNLFGVILLASAFLKWRAFGGEHSSAVFEVAPQLEWLAIQIETLLGAVLILGWAPRLSWLATIFVFSCFAGASLILTLQGRSSCGCLGDVKVNPLWMLLLDLSLIGLLMRSKQPESTNQVAQSDSRFHSPKFQLRSVVATLVGLCVGVVTILKGAEIGAALARAIPPSFTGQYVMTEPPIVDLGTGYVGDWRTVNVTVRNRSSLPITLIGAEKNCRCQADSSLPLTIAPGESKWITVQVRMGDHVGVQRSRILLRTDHHRQPVLLCRWQANVTNPVQADHIKNSQTGYWKSNRRTVDRHVSTGSSLIAQRARPKPG